MKRIVLFDMDGTLTPARKVMEHSTFAALKSLHKNGYEIGIVTGSGMDYIKEQGNLIKVRENQLIIRRDWKKISDKIKGAYSIVADLAQLATK